MQRTIAPQRMEVWYADLPMKMGSSVQGVDTPDGGQSVILAEQIMTIDKSCLNNRLGKIKAHDMKKMETAILAQLGMKGEQE